MDSSAVAYSIWPFLGREDAPFRSLRQGGEAPSSAAQFAPARRFPHVAAHAARAAGLVRACEVAALQIQLELRGAQRAGVEMALHLSAAFPEQEAGLLAALHALRQGAQPEIVRHGNQRAHDGGILVALGDAVVEIADMVVDLGGEYARLVEVCSIAAT